MPLASVLIVDDDDATRMLLVDYLSGRGLQADAVRDGAEALHRLSTHCYKVVILDVMMPHMSGIDVLDSLEALARDPSLQNLAERPEVLVITSAPAETMCEDELRRRSSYVRGLMHKPFDICTLADRIERLLSAA
jgi:CheY-like chemotaxis protein